MWKKTEKNLYKKFVFDSFEEALEFINKVGELAISQNHHPKITNSFNVVELELCTHSEGGIVTKKDDDFAEKLDQAMTKTVNQKNTSAGAKLFTDGGSRGNPGPSGTGYVIFDSEGNVLAEKGEYIGTTTNNQAEYQALKKGLTQAAEMGIKNLSVFMDSELIIKQINGQYRVKNQDLLPHYEAVTSLKKSFDLITFTHVLRSKNSVADGLVNKALDEHNQ